MSIEIIDLTNTPDSPPSSPISLSNVPTILNFGPISTNPNLHQHIHHHNHQTTLLVPPPPGFETPQIATSWPQPNMHHNQVTTVLKPLSEPNTFQFSYGARPRVPWTQLEHDLFVMGLMEYGKGKWSKIAKHFVCNKTPQQVQSYATNFFKRLPVASMHAGFRKRKLVANPNYSASNDPAKETLTLLPEIPPFYYNAPTYYGGEASSSNTTNNYGASTSMTLPSASGQGEVDLELRLGLN
uniref:MYB family transcription factor n=1 Tax=Melilotus albus TaxID=47082 RepID=A0A896WC86_MELAB|nr:MYB family transcription factor [Melilotus albus]